MNELPKWYEVRRPNTFGVLKMNFVELLLTLLLVSLLGLLKRIYLAPVFSSYKLYALVWCFFVISGGETTLDDIFVLFMIFFF